MSTSKFSPLKPNFKLIPLGLAAALLASSGLAFIALLGWQTQPSLDLIQDPWLWQLLRFSLLQASLSCFLAVGLALPLARALVLDKHLPGKQAFLRWCLLCFVMPSLVLITGLIAWLGHKGWATSWLQLILGPDWSIYGLNGILIAHVFLNLPLALRVLSAQWGSIPGSAWQLAAQLQLTGWQRFLLVELPALKGVLPNLLGLIFLLCFNSFAVVLTLGGSPAYATLEVAIYQALHYNFNPGEALFLAGIQVVIAGGIFWLISSWGQLNWLSSATGKSTNWHPQTSSSCLIVGRLAYIGTLAFLTLPLISLLPAAFSTSLVQLPWLALLKASAWSLGLALSSCGLALLIAFCLVWYAEAAKPQQPVFSRLLSMAALQPLVLPGLVLSVGWYVLLLPWVDLSRWGWLIVIWLNVVLALPFAFKQLQPEVFLWLSNYRRLAASLGLTHWIYWRYAVWPLLRPTLGQVAGLTLVLSLGDFAVFAIFGQPSYATLPWLIYELAASYQISAAACAALVLLGLAFAALQLLDKSTRI